MYMIRLRTLTVCPDEPQRQEAAFSSVQGKAIYPRGVAWTRLLCVGVLLTSACNGGHLLGGKTCDPSGRTGGSNAGVDYSHFLRHDDGMYVAPLPQEGPEPQVGGKLGSVICTFSASSTPLSYDSSREGEAGFVPEGTPYFAIRGCPERSAIAAEWQGRLHVFIREPAQSTRPVKLSDLPAQCGASTP
jgi:hypothetical protein